MRSYSPINTAGANSFPAAAEKRDAILKSVPRS